jgi:Fic family protein
MGEKMIFEFDDFDVRDRFYNIDEKIQKLNMLLESISQKQHEYFNLLCEQAYIYHDTALEGVVLSYDEIIQITSGEGLFGKSRILQEIVNHKDALKDIKVKFSADKNQSSVYRSEIITYDEIISLHQKLYCGINRREPGKLRRVIPMHTAYFHTFVDPKIIENKLRDLCKDLSDAEFRTQHPINQAILFHYRFMKIFPFLIGSGKIGRLFMNGFLTQGGYLPCIIHSSERQRYYESLMDKPEELRDLILDSMEFGLDAALRLIRVVEEPKETMRVYSRINNLF